MERQLPPELDLGVGSRRFEIYSSAHRIRVSAIHSLYCLHYAREDLLTNNHLFVYQRETNRSMRQETGVYD